MTIPRGLAEEFPDAAQVLKRLPPATLAAARARVLWEGTLERRQATQARALPKYWLPVFLSAAATAAALVLWVAGRPAYVPEATAQVEQRAEAAPVLKLGVVHGAPSAKVAKLSTPHAAISWTNARFLLEVTTGATVLSVESGEVVWRSEGAAQRVTAGHTVRSAGSDLAEQNALFEAGRWEEYLRRFPDGPLAPEASFARIRDLLKQQRDGEALEAARRHEQRFTADAFAAQVHAIRLELEHGR